MKIICGGSCISSTLCASWFHLLAGYLPLGPREGQHWTQENGLFEPIQGLLVMLALR